jgi:hypothetical protein
MMNNTLEHIEEIVTSWEGIVAHPHRFGGIEFNLGTTEIGHIHRDGMVDIPFNSKIRNQLIAEGKAEPHHLLADTGWISFYIHSDVDVHAAVDLFKLSYLFYASRGHNRTILSGALDIDEELTRLNLSEALRVVFNHVTRRR